MPGVPAYALQLPRPLQNGAPSTSLGAQSFPHRGLFFPLGFTVEIQTNSLDVLEAAQASWGDQTSLSSPQGVAPPLRLRLGVTPSASDLCPPGTRVLANGHLLSIIADAENFTVCDLQQGFAFGSVSEAACRHPAYLRYHFLEAAVMCLLTGSRVTPIHAACVSHDGRGLLLCGESGAGKSTLAYACAREGFTLTTDDASYVVWPGNESCVRGNAHQLRFRPSARELFGELEHLSITPRMQGKPSIEVRSVDLPILVEPQASVHALIMLHRWKGAETELVPISSEQIFPLIEASLFPLEGIYERQIMSLQALRNAPAYELRYRDLAPAIVALRGLTVILEGE